MLVLKQDDTVISVIYGDNGPGFLIDPDRLVDITWSSLIYHQLTNKVKCLKNLISGLNHFDSNNPEKQTTWSPYAARFVKLRKLT